MKFTRVIGIFGIGFALSVVATLLNDRQALAGQCSISVGGGGHTETVDRNISQATTIVFSVSSWDFLRSTSGRCHFQINFDDGTYTMYGSGITDRIRFGNSGGNDRGSGIRAQGYVPSPVSVRLIPVTGSCGIILGDNGRSQIFWGNPNTKIDGISGWDFIRETWGNCRFTVYNRYQGEGRSYSVNSGVNHRIRVGWRIRSLEMESSRW